MSQQNLHSSHGVIKKEPEEPSLGEYIFCQECQDYVHKYCSIHTPLLMEPNSKKEEQSESPQMLFSVKAELENCNSDNIFQNDRDYMNPITNSNNASGKYPDEKLANLLAILEKCSSSNLKDTIEIKETQTHPPSLNDIEIALSSENSAEKDSYIKRIKAQLDEEIMRDLEAEAKIFKAIQVSKGYRLMIAKESIKKKSEENRSIIKVKNEDICESGLIIVDNGEEDVDTISDTVCEETENNFHTEIVNEKNAMDCIDDHVEDIAQRGQMTNRLVKETIKNLCKKQSEEAVTNNPHTSTSNNNKEAKGICIKSKRKLQTTNLSLPKLQNNDVDAGETDLKSEPNLKKNTFVIKKETFQEPVFRNLNSEKKSKEKNTYVAPKKQENKTSNYYKNTQKANINVINEITAKFECNECGKQFSSKDILSGHIIKCIKTKTLVNNSQLKRADTSNSLLPETNQFKTNRKCSIEAHLKMHSNTKVLSCDICEYRCMDKSILKKHKQAHRVEKSFGCNICEYRCTNKTNLIRHKRIHTGEKPFGCNICEYRCSQKSSLNDHIRTHTGEKPFSCNICEYRCSQKSSLIRHKRTHTGEKPFGCNICGYRCSQKRNITIHIRTHTGEKPFGCNICEYRCSQKSSLNHHIRTHTGENPFCCNICDYRCSRKNDLLRHIRTHTGEKPFSCNICEYRCSLKSHLKDHIRTHTGENPFCCNICDYRCSRKNDLLRHIRTHTGEKPFSCNICEYRCSLKSSLNHDIRTHTGQNLVCCNICDYRCSRKNDLLRHIRTHTGEKPFSCNICEYRCSLKSHLKDHIRTHTGEKPFSCNICEYRCSQKSSLKDHIKTHTGDKPFSCKICNYRCSRKRTLKCHIKIHG